MKLAASALAAAALALAPGAGPQLPSAPLLALVGDGMPPRLVRLSPETLAPLGPGVPLGRSVVGWARSPDGSRLALGSRRGEGVRVVDTRRMRVAGRIPLRPEAQPLVWLAGGRIVALASPHPSGTVLVLDAVRRRVVATRALPADLVTHGTTGREAVLLLGARHAIGAARLAVVDGSGAIREVSLDRVAAGGVVEASQPYRARRVNPGLAVDAAGGRAFVVGAAAPLVAEVDLSTLEVSYHRLSAPLLARLRAWLLPAATAKIVTGPYRAAAWLGDGRIVVSGFDRGAGAGETDVVQTPAGLLLVDTRTWTVRTIDGRASWFRVAGGTILAGGYAWDSRGARDGSGFVAYELSGVRRFEAFRGEVVRDIAASGRYAYVPRGERPRERVAVVDLRTGEVVRELSRPLPLVLARP